MSVDNRSVGVDSLTQIERHSARIVLERAVMVGCCLSHAPTVSVKGSRPSQCTPGVSHFGTDRTGRVSSGVEWPATKKAPALDASQGLPCSLSARDYAR